MVLLARKTAGGEKNLGPMEPSDGPEARPGIKDATQSQGVSGTGAPLRYAGAGKHPIGATL